MSNPIKVVVVDDHSIFRKGLVMLLEEINGIEVCGEAVNGKDFVDRMDELAPDVVLMDVKMPEMGGAEAARIAISRNSKVKIIALSMYDQDEYIKNMLEVGAKGFLLKNIQKDELEKAIRIVSYDGIYYSAELSNMFINNFLGKGNRKKTNVESAIKLTNRELDVLRLVCKEMTNQQIAERLYISERTVHGHRANLMNKLNVANTVGLVKFAIRYKYIDPEDL